MQKKLFQKTLSICLALSIMIGLLPQIPVLAAEDTLKICVISDTHYYPLTYVSDCEDYQTYVNGDPKMLAESGSVLDSAVEMIEKDQPDIVLVSGDLTKDGEKKGHQEFAAEMQQIEDQTDAEVFVINGNHDIYNYLDACTFENGKKENTETVTPAEFKEIYANFGYNGEFDAEYYTPPQGKQAGGLSYAASFGNYMILALDSGMYSPDATGMETNEHITAGRVDEDLLVWAVDQIQKAEAEGKTVIGLMHHGLVPHFDMEDEVLSEYVVENWEETATTLADAGLRYIFTGHMHANDIAEYTTVNGNHLTDVETGSLSSWGSPVRSVTFSKGEKLNDGTSRTRETFTVSSESIKSIVFNGEVIEDFPAYTMDKLYPETMLNNMANGMLVPILKQISEKGIREFISEMAPDLDINGMILSMVQDSLKGGMQLELGSGIGRVNVSYRNGGIQLSPSGTAGLIGDMTITDAQIIEMVDDLLNKVETRYIDNPDYLLNKIDEIITKVSNFGVASLGTPEEKSLYDLVVLILINHYQGAENPPEWVEEARAYIQSGEIISNLIDMLLDEVMVIVDDLTTNLSVDTGIAFSGVWKIAIDAKTDNGNLKAILDMAGLDVRTLIEGLLNEYMSESFLTGMGGLIDDVASSMLYDDTQDDGENGEARTIVFDGTVQKPEPSAENGLLPDQVTMTFGSDAETGRAFSWYTGTMVDSGAVQLSSSPDFSGAQTITANTTEVVKPKTLLNLGLITTYATKKVNRHTAEVENLEPGTTYYYRVGSPEQGYWSGTVSFTTDGAQDDSFTFINVNDSQGMVQSDYETYLNTLEQADEMFPDASFLLHGGDFVDDGSNENYWSWVLDNPVSMSLPITPAAGNHEDKSDVEGVTTPNALMSHFNFQNLPEQDTDTGVYYSYEYENATFIVLNTNDVTADGYLSDAQYDWAYETAKNAGTEWKIILLHKSPYSNGPHAQDDDVAAIRRQLNQLSAECDIDLVLSGHDHVYNRTPWLSYGDTQQVETQTTTYEGTNYETAIEPDGTLFLIAGTAGVKNYVQEALPEIPSAVALDLDCPVYTGFTIDGDCLYYEAYKVEDGKSVKIDSFAIDKEKEEVTPDWEKVVAKIEALPDIPELSHKTAVEEARTAYDALSNEDKAKVTNYEKLQQAEAIIKALTNIQNGQTVTVSSKKEFVNALNNSNVTTIIANGTIEFENFWGNEREYTVSRDLTIRGSGVLRYVEFHVTNGATLVLDDSIYINDTRSQGSTYGSLNPIEVYANSTLITRGSAQLRTEYGRSGAEDGHGIKLMESGAKAYLNSSGSVWGAEGAVYSPASGTEIVINNGTYGRKNDSHRAVDTYGDLEINGGTVRNLWVSSKSTLYLNGGELNNGSELNPQVPLDIEGTAYVTGGKVVPLNGQSVDLNNTGKMHILTNGSGALDLGNNVKPWTGSVQTENYKDITVSYTDINGFGSSDGIYQTTSSANTPEGLAAAGGTRLDTSAQNGVMSATLPQGLNIVYGKYYLVGGGKTAPSGITGTGGSAQMIVYGTTRLIENNDVTHVEIEGDENRAVVFEEGMQIRLTGKTLPANAFDNAVQWESSDEKIATVNSKGVVTLHKAGKVIITLRSVSNPNATDTVTIFAVTMSLNGPDSLDEHTNVAQYTASAGFEDSRLGFVWKLDNPTLADINSEGQLTKKEAGTVTVTAVLTIDQQETELSVSKKVELIETEVVSVDIDWGALDYNYELGDWNPDNHTYENGGWEATTENGDHITVTNTGNTEVNVHFNYQSVSGLEEVTGSFENNDFSLPAPDDSTESKQIVIFTPAGRPEETFSKQKLGQITVTIGGKQ